MSAQKQDPSQEFVIYKIYEWVSSADFLKIVDAKKLQGGWEIWAQVELMLWMAGSMRGFKLEREVDHIFQNTQADLNNDVLTIDLWFERQNINVNSNIGVELKCRTARETNATFSQRFTREIRKVSNALEQNRTPALMYAVAISDNLADLKGYDAVPNFANNPVRYAEIKPA